MPLSPDEEGLLLIVEEDLELLRSPSFLEGDVDDTTLRRSSVELRKLFVGDDELALRAWQVAVGAEPFVIEASNFEPTGVGDLGEIELASIGEATQPRGGVSQVHVRRGPLDDGKPRPYVTTPVRALRLQKYLRGYCMISNGVLIRRHEVIQFVANRLGGVHYGKKKWRPADDAIAGLEPFQIAGRDAVYLQLLAIGQELVRARSTERLLDAIKHLAVERRRSGTWR